MKLFTARDALDLYGTRPEDYPQDYWTFVEHIRSMCTRNSHKGGSTGMFLQPHETEPSEATVVLLRAGGFNVYKSSMGCWCFTWSDTHVQLTSPENAKMFAKS